MVSKFFIQTTKFVFQLVVEKTFAFFGAVKYFSSCLKIMGLRVISREMQQQKWI